MLHLYHNASNHFVSYLQRKISYRIVQNLLHSFNLKSRSSAASSKKRRHDETHAALSLWSVLLPFPARCLILPQRCTHADDDAITQYQPNHNPKHKRTLNVGPEFLTLTLKPRIATKALVLGLGILDTALCLNQWSSEPEKGAVRSTSPSANSYEYTFISYTS